MIHAAFSEKPTISVGSTEAPLGKVKKKKQQKKTKKKDTQKYTCIIYNLFIYCCLAVDYKKKRNGKKWPGVILSNLLNICLS